MNALWIFQRFFVFTSLSIRVDFETRAESSSEHGLSYHVVCDVRCLSLTIPWKSTTDQERKHQQLHEKWSEKKSSKSRTKIKRRREMKKGNRSKAEGEESSARNNARKGRGVWRQTTINLPCRKNYNCSHQRTKWNRHRTISWRVIDKIKHLRTSDRSHGGYSSCKGEKSIKVFSEESFARTVRR
jgi:hypothetical protein